MENKQICRLCLEIVPSEDAEAIGEKKKEILDILLINVDLHIIDNAVACSRCMEKVQSGFEFKSACFQVDNCISTIVDADVPVDMKEIFQGEMRGTAMANVNLENRQICRLCMALIEDKALGCNTDLKDIIANCLPEVDLHRVHEPVVCELCFSQMKNLNEFINACQEIEQRINNYYLQAGVDHAIPVSVNINDLLKFKDNTISGLITEESSNFDSDLLKEPKKEDTANIEFEEIYIKDELASGDEMGDSVPSGACISFRNSRSLKRKREVAAKGRRHFPSDGGMVRHGGGHKKFACQECTYKTDTRSLLARHVLRHRDKSEVEMYKCANCEYDTKWKLNLIRHMLKHRDPKADKYFKCDKCPYETNDKFNLGRHNLRHEDKLEVGMFRCETCEYETRFRGDMKEHVMKHRDPKAEKKLKCAKCPYQTDRADHLRQHSLIHKDKSEVQMLKCETCEYKTRYKGNMNQHMMKHRDRNAERKFKCDKCPYKTDFKSCLRAHSLVHKDKSEVEMHKCDNCEYETKFKSSMVKHKRRKH